MAGFIFILFSYDRRMKREKGSILSWHHENRLTFPAILLRQRQGGFFWRWVGWSRLWSSPNLRVVAGRRVLLIFLAPVFTYVLCVLTSKSYFLYFFQFSKHFGIIYAH